MDRRLISAYDKMTMPDRCSQRIEEALQKGRTPKQDGRYTQIFRESRRNRAWGTAIALVCLMMVICAGGTALFLGMQGQLQWRASNLPSFSETAAAPAATQTANRYYNFPYGEEAGLFLEMMCHVMPVWDGYASLDDLYWTEFTVRILNSFAYPVSRESAQGIYPGRVTTPAGEAILMDGEISMKWEQLNAFVQNVMGCQLPKFTPGGEYGSLVSYVDGTYSVKVTELPRLRYALQEVVKGSDSAKVTFGICREGDFAEVGKTSFLLYHADNDLGFQILGRPTDMRMTRMEDAAIEKVALAFAQGQFAADIETMKAHLSPREDSSLILNPFVQNSTAHWEKDKDYKLFGVRIFEAVAGGRHPVACVDYALDLASPKPQRSLILDLVETEAGWKIRNWNDGNPESYDPDREALYDLTSSISYYYLAGEGDWIRNTMTSDLQEPPVYEGTAENPQVTKIEIYFDYLKRSDAGELMADVFVEIRESEDVMNPLALKLHFVKQGGQWKLERIGEG